MENTIPDFIFMENTIPEGRDLFVSTGEEVQIHPDFDQSKAVCVPPEKPIFQIVIDSESRVRKVLYGTQERIGVQTETGVRKLNGFVSHNDSSGYPNDGNYTFFIEGNGEVIVSSKGEVIGHSRLFPEQQIKEPNLGIDESTGGIIRSKKVVTTIIGGFTRMNVDIPEVGLHTFYINEEGQKFLLEGEEVTQFGEVRESIFGSFQEVKYGNKIRYINDKGEIFLNGNKFISGIYHAEDTCFGTIQRFQIEENGVSRYVHLDKDFTEVMVDNIPYNQALQMHGYVDKERKFIRFQGKQVLLYEIIPNNGALLFFQDGERNNHSQVYVSQVSSDYKRIVGAHINGEISKLGTLAAINIPG